MPAGLNHLSCDMFIQNLYKNVLLLFSSQATSSDCEHRRTTTFYLHAAANQKEVS